MGTIVHVFDPNQDVYVIADCDNNGITVLTGKIIRVRTESLMSSVEVVYDIRLGLRGGTTEFAESDVFVDKDAALLEYATRIV